MAKLAETRGSTTATRRRRDRKAEIAGVAADLFCELGYHRVGIDDVAAKVGITGGAIYRHFANKEQLLARTLLDGLDHVEAVITIPSLGSPALDLDAVLGGMATLAVERRTLGLLLQREMRHLQGAERDDVQRRLGEIVGRLGALIGATRGELTDRDARLLARAVLAGLASASFHNVALARAGSERLMHDMAVSVAGSRCVPTGDDDDVPPGRDEETAPTFSMPARRASRREMLLQAAIQLFGSRGYWSARMEEVGAAAGITGPSIYQYFAGKADLLVAALERGAAGLQLGMSRALTSTATPEEALAGVVDSYVDFVLHHSDLMSLLLSETIYLPTEDRHRLRGLQHDYVAEWANLLVEVRPELTQSEALYLTHCVLGIVNDAARARELRSRAAIGQILEALGRDVLGVLPQVVHR